MSRSDEHSPVGLTSEPENREDPHGRAPVVHDISSRCGSSPELIEPLTHSSDAGNVGTPSSGTAPGLSAPTDAGADPAAGHSRSASSLFGVASVHSSESQLSHPPSPVTTTPVHLQGVDPHLAAKMHKLVDPTSTPFMTPPGAEKSLSQVTSDKSIGEVAIVPGTTEMSTATAKGQTKSLWRYWAGKKNKEGSVKVPGLAVDEVQGNGLDGNGARVSLTEHQVTSLAHSAVTEAPVIHQEQAVAKLMPLACLAEPVTGALPSSFFFLGP